MPKLTIKYQLMLLSAWVLIIFYPTQFADISLIDDVGALGSVLAQEYFSVWEALLPRSAEGGYYRPLIAISYWLDKQFWFLAPVSMHLESVLGHLFNCIALFYAAKRGARIYLGRDDQYLPLVVAMLFSVHPLVTEPVNWISGRTDIMMTNFALTSLNCLFAYRLSKARSSFALGLLCAAVALLAKESALGYLIAFPLLMGGVETPEAGHALSESIRPTVKPIPIVLCGAIMVCAAIYAGNYWLVLACACGYFLYLACFNMSSNGFKITATAKRLTSLGAALAAGLMMFFALRNIVFTSSVSKIGQTVNLMLADTNYTISMFLGALGFYVKKFLLPLPLNFYIHEIDPLYDLVGIPVLLGIIILLAIKELPSSLILAGFLVLLPALPFAFGTIAWTSYAERYLYLPIAFWFLALGLLLGRWFEWYPACKKYILVAAVFYCFAAGYITFERNLTWKTNVSLMADTAAQNQNKRLVREIYIKALINSGQYAEAEREYFNAAEAAPAGRDVSIDLALGGILVRQNRFNEALRLYSNASQRTGNSSEKLLIAIVELLDKILKDNAIGSTERIRLMALRTEYAAKLLSVSQNPSLLLEKGNSLMQAGSASEAQAWFRKALHYVDANNTRLKDRLEMLLEKSGRN